MNDRKALATFLKSLDSDDLIALKPDYSRGTQTDGHTDAAEVAQERGITGDYDVLFWHAQSDSRAFDRMGQLVSPLMLHWGGDHARIAALLAGIPEPYLVADQGPEEAFAITSTELDRWTDVFPMPTDASEVAARVQWLDNQGRDTWTDADWRWLNDVLREADTRNKSRVADALVKNPDHLDDDALAVLLADWVAIYKAAGDDGEPGGLLELLHARGDDRYDQTLADCLKQRGWRFRWSVAAVLGRHGGPESVATLYSMATAKARQPTTIAANPPAIRSWLKVRSAAEGRDLAEIALEALADPKFDAPAREDLLEEAAYSASPEPRPGRLIAGWLTLLERDSLAPGHRELVMEQLLKARWFDLEDDEEELQSLRQRLSAQRLD